MERATTSIVMGEDPSLEKWQELDDKVSDTARTNEFTSRLARAAAGLNLSNSTLPCFENCHMTSTHRPSSWCARSLMRTLVVESSQPSAAAVAASWMRWLQVHFAQCVIHIISVCECNNCAQVHERAFSQLLRPFWATSTRRTLCSGRHQTGVGSAFVSLAASRAAIRCVLARCARCNLCGEAVGREVERFLFAGHSGLPQHEA